VVAIILSSFFFNTWHCDFPPHPLIPTPQGVGFHGATPVKSPVYKQQWKAKKGLVLPEISIDNCRNYKNLPLCFTVATSRAQMQLPTTQSR
jgi:hypothetical protein